VGAIATQAYTDVSYGFKGLKLLKEGFSPREALKTMLKEDPNREFRQVTIIDCQGRTAAFTGEKTVDWKGHLIGRDYVAAGNMLVGGDVIGAMARAFEGSDGDLADRLMKALEAGQHAGGDKRGKVSAALLVVGDRPTFDLRVDRHSEPVGKLRRMFEEFMGAQKT
jgi:uncharacterized Ntn-hydrolase superfamily protein